MDTPIHQAAIDFTLKSALVGVFCLLSSVGSNAAETPSQQASGALQELAADEAYVMVKMDNRSLSGVRTASFSLTANNNLQLNINKESEMQLIKVKAGVYKPQLAKLNRAKGIVIEPGTVTYIGDWKVVSGQKFLVNGVAHTASETGYRVNFDVDGLFSFAEENSWLKQYPLHISHLNGKRISNNWTRSES